MPVIDKNMYDKLKSWFECDEKCQYDQSILYVNSRDRSLTDATIKKLMFDLTDEDKESELFISLNPAENIHRNMRSYFLEIAECYYCESKPKAKLTTIIRNIPPTCSWILFIVKNFESLSGQIKEIQDIMKSLTAFGNKGASILLVGEGKYQDIVSGCEYALQLIAEKDDYGQSVIGFYDQEPDPIIETVHFESTDKQLDELNYYWRSLHMQLQENYFDYRAFKPLFRDTLEYLISRVSLKYVYRKDVSLIENMNALNLGKYKDIDGCKPWEKDAALQFITGLNNSVINRYGPINDFSVGKVKITVIIKSREIYEDGVHSSTRSYEQRIISADNACEEIDKLADEIFRRKYKDS